MTEPTKVAEQRELYGEPIGVLVHRITAVLGISQARVAATLGLSPAMLSQLVGGKRVKIGNPLAVSRLQSLLALVDQAPQLSAVEATRQLDRIRDQRSTLTDTSAGRTTADRAQLIRSTLHAVASGREIDQAVRALEPIAPGLAELLRAHGAGTPAEARSHLESIAHLL